MKLRTLLLILAAVVATVVAAVTVLVAVRPDPAPPFTPPPGPDLAYAYTTLEEVVVRRGGTTLARMPVVLDHFSRVWWSGDGRYITALPVGGSDANRLLSLDITSGKVTELPCPRCEDFVAVGEHSIFARLPVVHSSEAVAFPKYRNDDKWVLFDLADPENSRLVSIYSERTDSPAFATRDTVVMENNTSNEIGDRHFTTLRLISTDRPSTFTLDGDYFDGGIYYASDFGGTGQERMVITVNDGGNCDGAPRIWLLTPTYDMLPTDISAAQPPDRGYPTGVDVADLWFAEGNFYASIGSWTCTKTPEETESNWLEEEQTVFLPYSLWKLDLATLRWVDQHAQPARQTRFIGNSAMISLAKPDCIGYDPRIHVINAFCREGPLYEIVDQRRMLIADQVTAIYTAPPK